MILIDDSLIKQVEKQLKDALKTIQDLEDSIVDSELETHQPAQVGDKIRIVNAFSGDEEYDNGDVLYVKSVGDDGDVTSYVDTSGKVKNELIVSGEFAVIKSPETGKYAQVGDKILIVDSYNDGDHENGDLLTVVGYAGFGDVYKYENEDGEVKEGNISSEEYIVIKRAETGEPAQVGDRIRIVEDTAARGLYRAGDVVYVAKANEFGDVLGYIDRHGDKFGKALPKDVYTIEERAEDSATLSYIEAGRYPYKLHKGDLVRLADIPTIWEIKEINDNDSQVIAKVGTFEKKFSPEDLELVCPHENRVDLWGNL